MHQFSHDWISPIILLTALSLQCDDIILLHSSMSTSYSGEWSWLACDICEKTESDDIALLDELSKDNSGNSASNTLIPQWLGYVSYEAGYKNTSLSTPLYAAQPPLSSLPLIQFARFARIFAFHHPSRTLTEYTQHGFASTWHSPQKTNAANNTPYLRRSALQSNMTKNEYLQHITSTIEGIEQGKFYQANITRKFFTTLESTPDTLSSIALFEQLCAASPAPYSAYLQFAHTQLRILSASPELFLSHGTHQQNQLISRPIKGTAPLIETASSLAKSAKNQAENLMIVDLMRNDFSKIAKLSSVHVPHLFDVDSFSTLRHLSSTITAQTHPNTTLADIFSACFPAGSMTGAPKRRVMEWCNSIEQAPRGIYSGCIGWISGKTCEFSVVIRTILQQKNYLEFQVGGGIVYDSLPLDEWRETLIKARAICEILGIDNDEISSI